MKTAFIVYISLVVMALSACQKPAQDQATVPGMDPQCVSNPSVCQSNIYNNAPGFTPYNYSNGYYNPYSSYYGGGYNYSYSNYGGGYINPFQNFNNSNYLCNCPAGSVPTYNGYAGLGCVQASMTYGNAYAYFGWGVNNTHWTNIPQISNYEGYSQSNSSCYNGVVQSCVVNQPSTCATGYTCRANAASSMLGLCVANSTTIVPNNYNNGYNVTPR